MSRVAGQERGPTIWWSQAKWHLVWQKSPVFAEKPQAICSTALSSSAFWNNYLPSFSGTVLALAIPARIHVDHVEQCFHQGPTVSGKVWKNLWSFSQLGSLEKILSVSIEKNSPTWSFHMHFYNVLFKIDNFTSNVFNYYIACSWTGYIIRKRFSLAKVWKFAFRIA